MINRLHACCRQLHDTENGWELWTAALIGAVIGIVSLRSGYFVVGGDAILPALNPDVALAHLFHTWNSAGGLGQDTSVPRPMLFPFVLLDWAAFHIGIPPLVINNGWLVSIVALQSLSAAWLYRTLFPNGLRAAAIYVGVVAVANPFFLLTFHSPYPSSALSIALLPSAVAMLYRFARRATAWKFLALFGLLFAIAVGNVNYGVTLAELLVVGPICLLFAFLAGTRLQRFLYLLLVATAFVAANALWIVPAGHFVIGSIGSMVANAADYTDSTLRVTAQYSQWYNVLRLIGDYLFFNNSGGRPFLADGQQYVRNPIVVAASYVPPIVASLVVVVFRRDRKIVAIGSVCVLGLFLAKGAAPPFGFLFKWLFEHTVAFKAFRDSYSKFEWVPMYCYAILSGCGIAAMYNSTLKHRFSIVCIVIVAGLLAGYPVIVGRLFTEQSIVRVPKAYFDLAHWLNGNDTGSRIIEMPVSPYYFDTYKWGYVGAGLNPNLIAAPIISRMYDFASPGTQALDDIMQDYRERVGSQNVANILGLYGVRYILSDKSINPRFFSPSFQSENLGPVHPGIKFFKRFGSSISLYRLRRGKVNTLFYVPEKVFSGPRTLEEVADICRLHRTCKNVAFLPPGGAEMKIQDYYAVTYRQHAPTNTGDEVVAHRASYIGRASVHAPKGALVDDANQTTVSAGTAPDVVVYGGVKPAVITSIGEANGSGERTIEVGKSFVLGPRIVRLCQNAHETSEAVVATLVRSRGDQHVLLSMHYQANAPLLLRVVAREDAKAAFFASLKMDGHSHVFVRALSFPQNVHRIDIQFQLMHSAAPGCAQVAQLSAAPIKTEHLSWFGGASTFHATPAYFLIGPNPRAVYMSSRISIARKRESPPLKAAAIPTDTSSAWTDFEALDNRVSSVSLTPPGQAGDLQRAVVVAGRMDVHAVVSHLSPGGDYRIGFHYVGAQGGSAKVAFTTSRGFLLKEVPLPKSESRGFISENITVPPDVTSVMVYAYLMSNGASRASLWLGPRTVSPLDRGYYATIVLSAKPRRFRPEPTVSILKRQGDRYEVMVRNAPPHFLLVMNNTFSRDWVVRGGDISSVNHTPVNLFANGWIITGKKRNVTLEVSYDGDSYAFDGLVISLISLLFGLSLTFFARRVL